MTKCYRVSSFSKARSRPAPCFWLTHICAHDLWNSAQVLQWTHAGTNSIRYSGWLGITSSDTEFNFVFVKKLGSLTEQQPSWHYNVITQPRCRWCTTVGSVVLQIAEENDSYILLLIILVNYTYILTKRKFLIENKRRETHLIWSVFEKMRNTVKVHNYTLIICFRNF